VSSLLLCTAARIIVPLQLVASFFLLLRGHNEPGGGFAGGLLAASAIILHGLAHGMLAARRLLHITPQVLIGVGLLIAAGSGLVSMIAGLPFLTGLWGGSMPTLVVGDLKFGTPLLFDIGVYLVVTGVSVLLVFSMTKEED
jgi:multicomponent Na+:H+ antiporter subunit B